jgi:hypothetical protein
MITMRVECAIGVEPMNSTLCRREPWPLGYAHRVAWDGFEPSQRLLQGQLGYQLPYQAKVGEEGFEPSTARFQIGYADQLRYSPSVVATSATGTARALREREQPSSKSKHDEGRRGRRAT